MKRPKKKNNLENMQKMVMEWIWVVLLVSAILFLKGLLSDMHTETTRLSEERERFQKELTEEREKSKELYQEYYAEMNESIKGAIEAINRGEISTKLEKSGQ